MGWPRAQRGELLLLLRPLQDSTSCWGLRASGHYSAVSTASGPAARPAPSQAPGSAGPLQEGLAQRDPVGGQGGRGDAQCRPELKATPSLERLIWRGVRTPRVGTRHGAATPPPLSLTRGSKEQRRLRRAGVPDFRALGAPQLRRNVPDAVAGKGGSGRGAASGRGGGVRGGAGKSLGSWAFSPEGKVGACACGGSRSPGLAGPRAPLTAPAPQGPGSSVFASGPPARSAHVLEQDRFVYCRSQCS